MREQEKTEVKKEQQTVKEKREITSTTYIRAQKRLQSKVDSWFGRGMGK